MIAGGYDLHLYCEMCSVFGQFTGHRAVECRKQARSLGWKIDQRNRLCWCRTCRNKEAGR